MECGWNHILTTQESMTNHPLDSVENLICLFALAGSFNRPMGSWKVINVTDEMWLVSYYVQPLGL